MHSKQTETLKITPWVVKVQNNGQYKISLSNQASTINMCVWTPHGGLKTILCI